MRFRIEQCSLPVVVTFANHRGLLYVSACRRELFVIEAYARRQRPLTIAAAVHVSRTLALAHVCRLVATLEASCDDTDCVIIS